ncbi:MULTISPECIES: hypothetical protein [Pseudomonadota]|uniref:PRTRC system protein F n=1 Tax=Rhodanobacter denitrificans TaxID=666685 RepID=M4NMY6_9GAMM|nr:MULTISPECIES: hypothetical protein [Pseudomonadota]AGG89046.1 hypothetical protein R2APBS1_1923 [Rhodanobacter denitrificans]TAN24961.1 MAG: hypothetical protein EPN31_16365 [Castellaniella sp.]UJJ53074.1 hypothetical protein LRK52_18380 [Rhodanobacter denitrificans]
MTPIRFVHLPTSALATVGAMAHAAVPRMEPLARSRVAAAMRTAVLAGRLRPSAVLAALGGGPDGADAPVIALAERRARQQVRRLGPRPSLPDDLRCPFDPRFESQGKRQDMRLWLRRLVQAGALTGDDVHGALRDGGAAVADLITRWIDGELQRQLAALLGAVGVQASADELRMKWHIYPACAVLDREDPDRPAGTLVLVPDDEPAGFSLLRLGDTSAVAGFEPVLDALHFLHLSFLALVWPNDLTCSDFPDMFLEATGGYAAELVADDGEVTLSQDFLDHLSEEFDYEVDDPERRDALTRLLRVQHHARTRVRAASSVEQAESLLEQMAEAAPRDAGPLRAMRRLLTLSQPTRADRLASQKTELHALDEEAQLVLTHVISADLSGFEDAVIEDWSDLNMQVGAEGAFTVSHRDPMLALRLAVSDVCRITVLDLLLSRYVSAHQ